MLFQHCFANVETTMINVRRLNYHFQQNINVQTTLMNVDDQRCFNVDVFAGYAENWYHQAGGTGNAKQFYENYKCHDIVQKIFWIKKKIKEESMEEIDIE